MIHDGVERVEILLKVSAEVVRRWGFPLIGETVGLVQLSLR